MAAYAKQPVPRSGNPPPSGAPWLFGLVIGLAVANLAMGALLLGTGAAVGKAITERR
jgi:hypothetical protein